MSLSGNDTAFLDKALKNKSSGTKWLMVRQDEMGSATPKKMAEHCAHNDLLFYWSDNYYYVSRI